MSCSLVLLLYVLAAACLNLVNSQYCGPGHYVSNALDPDMTHPTLCNLTQAGYYSNTDGLTAQLACVPGSYCNSTGLTAPVLCPITTYCNLTGLSAPVACPPGGYCDAVGMGMANACPVSKYCNASGLTAPLTCPKGFFCPVTGLSAAPNCTGGWFCNDTGLTRETGACQNGTFCSPGSVVPSKCNAGFYCPTTGLSAARACPFGYFYSSTLGLTSCIGTPCNLTYYCPAGATSQLICPSGSYCDIAGISAPITCPAGYYCASTGLTAVSGPCDAGYYCPAASTSARQGACPAGYFNQSSDGLCLPCSPGTYSSTIMSTSCTLCPAGSQAFSTGMTACEWCRPGWFAQQTCLTCPPSQCSECNPGTYANASGLSTCSNCVSPSWNYVFGSSSCLTCDAGYYLFDSGCLPCPAGTATSTPGTKRNCLSCYQPYYQPFTNATACLLCNGVAASAKFCSLDCLAGNYYVNQGFSGVLDFKCLPCPAGLISTRAQTAKCSTCPVSGTIPDPGRTSCSPCGIGTYADAGFSACAKCPQGRFSGSIGMGPVCPTCQPGSFPDANRTSCLKCVAGQFAQPGFSVCLACPTGTYAPNASTSSCLNCTAGYYPDANATACLLCAPGTISTPGMSTCRQCPAGTSQPVGKAGMMCNQCPAGRFNSNVGFVGNCSLCPIGLYSTGGAAQCSACGPGTFTLQIGTSACALCPIGTEWAPPNSCQNCSLGYYSNTPGTQYCVPCPSGYYQPENSTNRTACILVPPPPPPAPTPIPVGTSATIYQVRLRFQTTLAAVSSKAVQANLTAAIAAAIGIVPPSRLRITGLVSGSVMIDFQILPVASSAPGATSQSILAAALVSMAVNRTTNLTSVIRQYGGPSVDATYTPVQTSSVVVQCSDGVWLSVCPTAAPTEPPSLYNPPTPHDAVFYAAYVFSPIAIVVIITICCCVSEDCCYHEQCFGCFTCLCPCVARAIRKSALRRRRAANVANMIGVNVSAPIENGFGAEGVQDEPESARSSFNFAPRREEDSSVPRRPAALEMGSLYEVSDSSITVASKKPTTPLLLPPRVMLGGRLPTETNTPKRFGQSVQLRQYSINPEISDDDDDDEKEMD